MGQKTRDWPFLRALGAVLGWEAEKGQGGFSYLKEPLSLSWGCQEPTYSCPAVLYPPRAGCVFLTLPSSAGSLGLGLGCSLGVFWAVSQLMAGGESHWGAGDRCALLWHYQAVPGCHRAEGKGNVWFHLEWAWGASE